MTRVTARELCSSVGNMLRRVGWGKVLMVIRDGIGVAEIRQRARPTAAPADLIARRQGLPAFDPTVLREDVDAVLDPRR